MPYEDEYYREIFKELINNLNEDAVWTVFDNSVGIGDIADAIENRLLGNSFSDVSDAVLLFADIMDCDSDKCIFKWIKELCKLVLNIDLSIDEVEDLYYAVSDDEFELFLNKLVVLLTNNFKKRDVSGEGGIEYDHHVEGYGEYANLVWTAYDFKWELVKAEIGWDNDILIYFNYDGREYRDSY